MSSRFHYNILAVTLVIGFVLLFTQLRHGILRPFGEDDSPDVLLPTTQTTTSDISTNNEQSTSGELDYMTSTKNEQSTSEKLGYVTWLGKTGNGSDTQDNYFVATRLLAYQILHDPSTRSPQSLPCIILCTPDVTHANKQRLRDDGATVVEIEFINEGMEWLKPRRPTWAHIMSKLRAWELTDYSRLLLLDGDTILRRPLDNVFDEFNATMATRVSVADGELKQDENPIPARYLFAGGPEVNGADHHFPPSVAGNDFLHPSSVNLGFVMLAPSREMFEYYLSILRIPGRFNSNTMEQSLLNYAHRPNGPMPWQTLPPTYNIRAPVEEDIVGNVASLHTKWWLGSKTYPPLRKFEEGKKVEMEEFYKLRDLASQR